MAFHRNQVSASIPSCHSAIPLLRETHQTTRRSYIISSTDVATITPEVQALLDQQEAALDQVTFRTPILKICQSTTKEVKAGDAEAGEFLNTLTGESYGDKVEFIVAFYQPGRAASGTRDTNTAGRYFVTYDEDLIPDSWSDLVGEEFVGTRFDEHPDAEEQFKVRVNSGEIKWGKGPLISTTYNYTGYVQPPQYEGEDEVPALMPGRISFLRSTKGAHEKLAQMKQTVLRNRPFWDATFELSTKMKEFTGGDSFIVLVRKVRPTTQDEKLAALQLAQAVAKGETEDNAATANAPEARPASEDEGGLEV